MKKYLAFIFVLFIFSSSVSYGFEKAMKLKKAEVISSIIDEEREKVYNTSDTKKAVSNETYLDSHPKLKELFEELGINPSSAFSHFHGDETLFVKSLLLFKENELDRIDDRVFRILPHIEEDCIVMAGVGILSLLGHGMPLNVEYGVGLLERSARRGCGEAKYILGFLYENGIGVEKNMPTAMEWYLDAAGGSAFGAKQVKISSLFKVGYMYEHGIGVEVKFDIALSFYRLAINDPDADSVNCADAYYAIGMMYMQGRGVSKNETVVLHCFYEAMKKYQALLAKGSNHAFFKLAQIFYYGPEPLQSYSLAYQSMLLTTPYATNFFDEFLLDIKPDSSYTHERELMLLNYNANKKAAKEYAVERYKILKNSKDQLKETDIPEVK